MLNNKIKKKTHKKTIKPKWPIKKTTSLLTKPQVCASEEGSSVNEVFIYFYHSVFS